MSNGTHDVLHIPFISFHCRRQDSTPMGRKAKGWWSSIKGLFKRSRKHDQRNVGTGTLDSSSEGDGTHAATATITTAIAIIQPQSTSAVTPPSVPATGETLEATVHEPSAQETTEQVAEIENSEPPQSPSTIATHADLGRHHQ